MMIALTDGAKAIYEDYISKVRACLLSSGTTDVDDVLADLREHVSEELTDIPEPASTEAMRVVLERLGSPDQWGNADDLPWGRKVLMRLRTGPNDWRLVYYSLATLIVGVMLSMLFADRLYNEPNVTVLAVFVAISFIFSRAAITATEEPLAPPQRWLAYPSLIIVYVAILGLVLVGVPIIGGTVGYELSFVSLTEYFNRHGQEAPYPPIFRNLALSRNVRALLVGVWMGVATGGVWLTLLGFALLFTRPRRLAACVFAPFLAESSKRWAVTILLLGLLLGAITLAVRLEVHRLFAPAACPWVC